MRTSKVVFICLGNSCRSIMAEALARHHFREKVAAASVGISPLGFVVPNTLEVLAEIGVSTAGLRSKGMEEIDFRACHLVVNLTDYPLKNLLPLTFPGRLLHRPVFDPYGGLLDDYRYRGMRELSIRNERNRFKKSWKKVGRRLEIRLRLG